LPDQLRWLNREWLTTTLPSIVLLGFALSLIVGVVAEARRLIGDELLASVVLGTYHRPARRVQDLITRFFFDIDEPIADFGGSVHAYVGDEVIIVWPETDDPVPQLAHGFCEARRISEIEEHHDQPFGRARRRSRPRRSRGHSVSPSADHLARDH
jgi:hypothetical protein